MKEESELTRWLMVRFDPTNLGRTIVVLAGLILSIYVGVLTGSGDFLSLTLIGVAVLSLVYILLLVSATWKIALLVCFIGFIYHPSFDLGSTEAAGALAFILAAVSAWRRSRVERSDLLREAGLRLFRFFLFIWLVYLAVHFFYNWMNPFHSAYFALSNALKSYFAMFAPVAIVWYFSRHINALTLGDRFFPVICKLCAGGLILNIAIRLYGILIGAIDLYYPAGLTPAPFFYIPFLNAAPSPYILREIGPLGILLSGCLLTTSSNHEGKRVLLGAMLLLLGIVGGVISGGRAAIVVGIIDFLLVLVMRRKWKLLFLALAAFLSFVVIANVFSDAINRSASRVVQRSFQWILLHKGESNGSIISSSEWRSEIFKRALAEWRSQSRIYWFGRATYSYGVEDAIAMDIAGPDAVMDSALRRGATHNLITDLLIAYGLVGCLIYYGLVVIMIVFLFRLWCRIGQLSASVQNLSLASLILSVQYIAVASVGGGEFPIILSWMLIVLFSAVSRQSAFVKAVENRSEVIRQRPALSRIPLR